MTYAILHVYVYHLYHPQRLRTLGDNCKNIGIQNVNIPQTKMKYIELDSDNSTPTTQQYKLDIGHLGLSI